jgi:N-acetylneuraminic acid mutarotase
MNQIRQMWPILPLAYLISCNPVPDDISSPNYVWLQATPLAFSRQNLPALVLDDRIFLVGGLASPTSEFTTLRDVSVYRPLTDVWEVGTPMPIPRSSSGGAVVGQRIYIAGGFSRGDFASSRLYIYDSVEDAWSQGARIPTRRAAHAVVELGGLVYAIGGMDRVVGDKRSVERYDPTTDQWMSLPDLPTARNRLAGVAHSGEIFTFGGSQGDVPVNVVEVFDPGANRWRSANPMPVPLSAQSAVSINENIYLFGGIGPDANLRSEVWRFNPGADEWTALPSAMPTPRQGMATTVHDGRVYLIGGAIVEGFEPSDANEVFVP